MATNLTLRTLSSPFLSPYNDTTKGSELEWAELDDNQIYLKGEIIYTATTSGTTLTLGKLNGNNLSIDLTANSYWISGSTGNFSIKRINDSGLDATGDYSYAEGYNTKSTGYTAHAEGYLTKAYGIYSHSEGNNTTSSGYGAHAEGLGCIASGFASHAEGQSTQATGLTSHAEGYFSSANGFASHAEGSFTTANGSYSHTLGNVTETTIYGSGASAIGIGSKAEQPGELSIASGTYDYRGDVQTRHIDLMYKGQFGDGFEEIELLINSIDRIKILEANTLYTLQIMISLVPAPPNTLNDTFSLFEAATIFKDNSSVINIQRRKELHKYPLVSSGDTSDNFGSVDLNIVPVSSDEISFILDIDSGSVGPLDVKVHANVIISKVRY